MVHDLRETCDIGIVGGGQLGLMLVQAAIPLGLRTLILDPDPRCPASQVAPVITGALTNAQALTELVSRCAVTTFEIEHTDPDHLRVLEAGGSHFAPSPRVLQLVADKLLQKEFFRDGGVPVPKILPVETTRPWEGSEPVIQKTRFGGYDGRGVAQVGPGEQFSLDGPTFVEEAVRIDREIAVVVAVSQDGTLTTWDPLDMVFDPRLNLVSKVLSPAALTTSERERAIHIASTAATLLRPLGLVGILAVELFIDTEGHILLNEVAPRPHNSGHGTIESSRCSQFEQHLRCVAGLPPGDTGSLGATAMVNLLGPEGITGEYRVEGRADALRHGDLHLHLYGKQLIRPGRKMGHLTARADDATTASRRAEQAAAVLRFHQM